MSSVIRPDQAVYNLFYEFFGPAGVWGTGISGLALHPADQSVGKPVVMTVLGGGYRPLVKVQMPESMASVLITPELWRELGSREQVVEIKDELRQLFDSLGWVPQKHPDFHLMWCHRL